MFGVGWYVVVFISWWGVEFLFWLFEFLILFFMKIFILFVLELVLEWLKVGVDDGWLGVRWDCWLMGFDLGWGGGVFLVLLVVNIDIVVCKLG